MKKILIICAISTFSIFCKAQNSYTSNYNILSSTVILEDGTKLNGQIDYPINSVENNLKLRNQNSETIKIEKVTISKIICNTSTGPIEYVNMEVYKGAIGSKIHKRKIILGTSMTGKVTLYFANKDYREYTGPNNSRMVSEIYYYCKRENEPAASLIHIEMNVKAIGKNSIFRQYGKKYFADNEEIFKKIDEKEFTYENLFEVIALYNSKSK